MFKDFKMTLLKAVQEYIDLFISAIPRIGIAIIILTLFVLFAAWMSTITRNRLAKTVKDPLLARFLSRVLKWSINLLGIAISLKIVGLGGMAGGFLAGAGVSAFVIGFAFKDIGENFLAGIILAFNRPFQVGHIVETNDLLGKVVALDLRTTQIKTFDGKDVFIPNGILIKQPLINFTIDGYLRKHFEIGLDYGSDVTKAIQIVMKVMHGVKGILTDEKAPSVHIDSLGDSALVIKGYYWLDTFDESTNSLQIQTDVVDRCLTELTNQGFYLPGNIVELKNYSSEDIKLKQATL